MPLHDNLERKRRENIAELNASGVCHLCKTTSGSRSYQSFVGNDDDGEATNNYSNLFDNASNNHQDLPQSPAADNNSSNSTTLTTTSSTTSEEDAPQPMRTCMCYGNTKSWPYGLKVCEVCIKDDVNSCTGRIRHCGICGVIACDENCGTELVECTDKEEWEQRGCLECRGLEGFNELELFRKRPYPSRDEDGKELPRATRVCMDCIELFSLFSFGKKYQFQCRYFKCNNLLVPSNLVELKRSLTPFPLSELPTEILDVIVDFLGARDLLRIGSVCSSLFKKVESVSKDIVTRFNHQLPSGPTVIMRSDKKHIKQKMVFAEGKNRHGLSSPADGKTWVGVLCQMEELTREIFYFDFQLKSDDGAAMRFLRNSDKLSFDRIFAKTAGINAPLIPYVDTGGLQVKGGQESPR